MFSFSPFLVAHGEGHSCRKEGRKSSVDHLDVVSSFPFLPTCPPISFPSLVLPSILLCPSLSLSKFPSHLSSLPTLSLLLLQSQPFCLSRLDEGTTSFPLSSLLMGRQDRSAYTYSRPLDLHLLCCWKISTWEDAMLWPNESR